MEKTDTLSNSFSLDNIDEDVAAKKRVSIQSLLNNSEANVQIDGFSFHTITTNFVNKNNSLGTILKDEDNKKVGEQDEDSDSPTGSKTKKRAKSNLMLEMCSELWMKHYTRLREYYKLYGNTNVTRTKAEWKTLGNWVAEQRRKMKNGKLSQEQLKLLNELGKLFYW